MKEVPEYAAIFVDFENVYYYLKNHLEPGADAGDSVVRMIRLLRDFLAERFGERAILNHAYADFDRIEETVQNALYLSGVESHSVAATERKNSADMRLSIDLLDAMYTREQIQTFVLMAGDRDYLPVVQHLQRNARVVRVVAFRGTLSGDLLDNVGEQYFLDAEQFLPAGAKLAAPVLAAPAVEAKKKVPPAKAATFEEVGALDDDHASEALALMLKNFGDKPEVWLTPYLYRLRSEMPLLAEYERRALLVRMEEAGAVRVEKRKGETNDYSVVVINWNHPDVQKLNG